MWRQHFSCRIAFHLKPVFKTGPGLIEVLNKFYSSSKHFFWDQIDEIFVYLFSSTLFVS
jgi:hypothetical protein